MFLIPGQLIAILTFPGVIVHEGGHRLFVVSLEFVSIRPAILD